MIKILAVDDSDIELICLCNELSKDEDVKVFFTNNPLEAVDIAKFRQPDVILLDVLMPNMDGIELRRKLLEESQTRDIPIIFLTSSTDITTKLQSYKLGCLNYITKPAATSEIMGTIRANEAVKALTRALDSVKAIKVSCDAK